MAMNCYLKLGVQSPGFLNSIKICCCRSLQLICRVTRFKAISYVLSRIILKYLLDNLHYAIKVLVACFILGKLY